MSTSPPTVSIGMPVYNGASTVRDAINSLLAQTHTDFELIISDNASTDDTEEICRKYATLDRRVRYVRQQKNIGARPNFRFVLNEGQGPFFMWAAADDTWHTRFLEACVSSLRAHEDAGMAMTAYRCSSRRSSLFDLVPQSSLACIQIEDMESRLLSYSRMSFASHKDNLVYGLWRSNAIRSLVHELNEIFGDNAPVGAAMNELALIRYRGVYLDEILFHKRYRSIPPGHWLTPLHDFLKTLKKPVIGTIRRNRRNASANQQFLLQLEKVLNFAGVRDQLAHSIIEANERHLRVRDQKGEPRYKNLSITSDVPPPSGSRGEKSV